MAADGDGQAQSAFDELARVVLAEHSVESVMTTIAEVSKRLLPHVDEASVTFIRGGNPATVAFTGDLAIAMDERQYDGGEGPCLASAQTGHVQLINDAVTEERWPAYAVAAKEIGLGSSLSIPVPMREKVHAALNLYSRQPGSFSDQDVELAQTLAGYASIALLNMHLFEAQAEVAKHLQTALESRAVIDQAKGILMGQRRCSADEAFAILVKLSQDSNRKLRDVAQALVDSAATV